MIENEIWRPIKGYEGIYEVSNLGRVKSLDRIIINKKGVLDKRNGKILTQTQNEKGYLRVGLQVDNQRKKYRVHRLVAEAFIPNPDNLPQINHKDENKTNNTVDNLEWCTNLYNTTYSMGKPVFQYTSDGTIIETYDSISQAVRQTGYSEGTITKSCKGEKTMYDAVCKWKFNN